MEKHIEIALANAQAALLFIDPWARVIAVQDDVRMARVLEELVKKYNIEGVTMESYTKDHDIYVYAELRMDVPCAYPDDIYPERHMDMPEFYLCAPRKYNEEYYRYRVGLTLEDRSISACQWPQGRQTPYTVEYIAEAKTQTQRKERFDHLVELGAPSTICFHEELMLRSWEYMLPIVEA